MATLTVTAKGQLTLRKDLLRHLGIEPGQKVAVEKLPNGRVELHAPTPTGTIDDFIGFLAGKTRKVLTIDEMNEVIAKGWAGEQ